MKNKFRQHITLGILSTAMLFSGSIAHAQEWNVEASGFINHQNFRKEIASGGYSTGIGYSQYLNKRWSIALGASFSQSRFKYIGHPKNSSFTTTDMEGDALEYRYTANFYYELDTWNSLQVPVTLQYETQGKVRWYLRTGIMYQMILGEGKSNSFLGNLNTSGYYPKWDAVLTGPDFAGFGAFGYQKRQRSLSFENTFSWMLESGAKWIIDAKHHESIYVGAFLNWGLNDMRPKGADYGRLVEFTSDINQPIDYRNIWRQEALKDKKLQDYSFGIRVRYGFGGMQ